MQKDAEFYQNHLDRVSRSFAFCIRQLPEPLRDWVALSYLLCRVVDTIEDAEWADKAEQAWAFEAFDQALMKPECAGLLSSNSKLIRANADERQLLQDSEILFTDLHSLPGEVKAVLLDTVHSMSLGMQHFVLQSPEPGLRLNSLSEVNQYCFFVAGLVGELLAKLLAQVCPSFQTDQETLLRAHHFGLFLQKVNLLKDQVTDLPLGRHLIPSRGEVENSAQSNAHQAFRFLISVPSEQIEFRRFCAWSLFLGLESLLAARDSMTAGELRKVSRARTQAMIAQVEEALLSESQLGELFTQAVQRLGWESKPTAAAQSKNTGQPAPEWLTRLYSGRLDQRSLYELGVSAV